MMVAKHFVLLNMCLFVKINTKNKSDNADMSSVNYVTNHNHIYQKGFQRNFQFVE